MSTGSFLGADAGVVVFTLIAVAIGLSAGMAITERLGLRPAGM